MNLSHLIGIFESSSPYISVAVGHSNSWFGLQYRIGTNWPWTFRDLES